jgi:pimeloyl-ACP methyl ester carboxylesterase
LTIAYPLAVIQAGRMTPELSPLVLLHGGSWSGDQWRDIAPLLSAHHDVYTPSALGHRGGPVVQRRPVTIWDVVDESERYLDERRLDRPHLAGHSMGGFIALELARRGRAASVCAFSPQLDWENPVFFGPGEGDWARQGMRSHRPRPPTPCDLHHPARPPAHSDGGRSRVGREHHPRRHRSPRCCRPGR